MPYAGTKSDLRLTICHTSDAFQSLSLSILISVVAIKPLLLRPQKAYRKVPSMQHVPWYALLSCIDGNYLHLPLPLVSFLRLSASTDFDDYAFWEPVTIKKCPFLCFASVMEWNTRSWRSKGSSSWVKSCSFYWVESSGKVYLVYVSLGRVRWSNWVLSLIRMQH